MAVGNIWKLHSLRFNDDTNPTAISIGSMASVSMQTDAEVVREVNAGRIYPRQAHTVFNAMQISGVSWNAAKMLERIGPSGLCVRTTNPQLGVSVFVAQYDCNGPVAGANHVEYRGGRGVIYVTTITVDHQGNVQVGWTFTVVSPRASARSRQGPGSGSAAGRPARFPLPESI